MKRYLYCFACLVGNLVAFGILLILVCQFGAVDTGLVLGGVFCVLGILAAFLSHLLAKDHTAAWALSILLLGASKGSCAAALLMHFDMASWVDAVPPLAIRIGISAGSICVLYLLFGLLLYFPAVRRYRKAVYCPLLLVLLIAAIVLAAKVREAFTVLFLLNSITLIFSCLPGLVKGDDDGELKLYLSAASALYAVGTFVVVLAIICAALGGDSCDCDCDCCEGCDGCCDCGGSGDDGGKKREMLISEFKNMNNKGREP